MKRVPVVQAAVLLVLLSMVFGVPRSRGAENALLQQGIEQYKKENFEEALPILKKAREQDPESATAAFFLGLTYKQLFEYQKAADQFRASLTMEPKIKEAVVELIEALYRIKTKKSIAEAKSWIAIAEKEGLLPAKVTFLEGLILQQEGKNQEAIAAFKKSVTLDPAYRQSAEIQIAMCYMRERDLAKAKERLQAAIQMDPATDLAGFARRYQDIVERRMEMEKPLRVTAGIFPQYDDNVVLNPAETTIDPVIGVTDEASYVTRASLRLDYVPLLKDPWLFNAQYAFLGSFYAKSSIRDNYNSLINSFSVSPGRKFGRFSLNVPFSYTHVMVMENGKYGVYLETFNVGPQLRAVVGKNHLLEGYASYNVENFNRPPVSPEEDRNSDGFKGYLSWFWTYMEGGFSNLKYEFGDYNAVGDNYDRQVHRLSLNIIYPIFKTLKLQLSGQSSFELYKNVNSVTKIPAPKVGVSETYVPRRDYIYQGTAGLTWDFYKNADLVLQWSHTRSNSNIDLYTYDRNLWTAGIEYRF